jgi:hypothetical protein
MNVFPLNTDGTAFGEYIQPCVDPAATIPAAVFDMNGAPIPNGTVVIASQTIPLFQSAASILYVTNTGGYISPIYPAPDATHPTITGSKGGNAALTSLISALAAQGLIVDTTT